MEPCSQKVTFLKSNVTSLKPIFLSYIFSVSQKESYFLFKIFKIKTFLPEPNIKDFLHYKCIETIPGLLHTVPGCGQRTGMF